MGLVEGMERMEASVEAGLPAGFSSPRFHVSKKSVVHCAAYLQKAVPPPGKADDVELEEGQPRSPASEQRLLPRLPQGSPGDVAALYMPATYTTKTLEELLDDSGSAKKGGNASHVRVPLVPTNSATAASSTAEEGVRQSRFASKELLPTGTHADVSKTTAPSEMLLALQDSLMEVVAALLPDVVAKRVDVGASEEGWLCLYVEAWTKSGKGKGRLQCLSIDQLLTGCAVLPRELKDDAALCEEDERGQHQMGDVHTRFLPAGKERIALVSRRLKRARGHGLLPALDEHVQAHGGDEASLDVRLVVGAVSPRTALQLAVLWLLRIVPEKHWKRAQPSPAERSSGSRAGLASGTACVLVLASACVLGGALGAVTLCRRGGEARRKSQARKEQR